MHKNAHFYFDVEIYVQIYSEVMDSPLRAVLTNIFMVQLKNTTEPRLENQN